MIEPNYPPSTELRPTRPPSGESKRLKQHVLADGARITVRRVTPDDEPGLRAAFDQLSPDSRYHRFLGHIESLSDWMWTHLSNDDGDRQVALVAVDPSFNIIGECRYIRVPSDPARAELAVVVADAWQRRGVGKLLLGQLCELARAAEIDTLVAHSFASNIGVARLLRRAGRVRSISLGEEAVLYLRIGSALGGGEPPAQGRELQRRTEP
ncbi:MAG: GNAT family N-acetyltransferase [Polyangiaceae bacterium]